MSHFRLLFCVFALCFVNCVSKLKLIKIDHFEDPLPESSILLEGFYYSKKHDSIINESHLDLYFSDGFLRSKKFGWRLYIKWKPYLLVETDNSVLINCHSPNPWSFSPELPHKIIGVNKKTGKILGQIKHIDAFKIYQSNSTFYFVSKTVSSRVLKMELQ